MKELKVTSKYDKKKLDVFLFDKFPQISGNLFFKTLRKKDIRINGKKISENIILHDGDIVSVYIADEILDGKFKLNKIFEDENVIIIDKPVNMEVVGENSITEIIQKDYKGTSFLPMPCHRLDRNTSGLLIFAKNKDALDEIEKAFKNHVIEKHYKALVLGVPIVKSKTLKAYLFKDRKKSLVYISDTKKIGYLEIVTSYTLLKRYDDNTSLLDVTIETGRTHQIRAHLAHIGHPIIGDGKYGDYEINKKFNARYQKLCCYKIQFNFDKKSKLNYLNDKNIVCGDNDED